MNVAELKKLLDEADDEAEVLFLDFEEADENGDGALTPIAVADLEEDADGAPVFVLCIDDADDEEDGDAEEDEEPDA